MTAKTPATVTAANGRIVATRTAKGSKWFALAIDGRALGNFTSRDLPAVIAEYEAELDKVSVQITSATQHATAHVNGRPLATIVRRSASDPQLAPQWKVFDLQGQLIRSVWISDPKKAHAIIVSALEHGRQRQAEIAAYRAQEAAEAEAPAQVAGEPEDFNTYRVFTAPPAYVAPTEANTRNTTALKWSGKNGLAPPAIGSTFRINFNNLGFATVTGYFCEAGWLGVTCRIHDAPEWHRKQRKGDPTGHIFGAEIEDVTAPEQADDAAPAEEPNGAFGVEFVHANGETELCTSKPRQPLRYATLAQAMRAAFGFNRHNGIPETQGFYRAATLGKPAQVEPIFTAEALASLPEGITVLSLDNPAQVHNAIAQAVDEPESEFAEAAARARDEEISGDDKSAVVNALRVAAETFKADAAELRRSPHHERLAQQFDYQTKQALALAERIEFANLLKIL